MCQQLDYGWLFSRLSALSDERQLFVYTRDGPRWVDDNRWKCFSDWPRTTEGTAGTKKNLKTDYRDQTGCV